MTKTQQMTINLWSHIRNLKNTLIGILIGLLIGALCHLITNRDDLVIYFFCVGYLLAIIPVILIHFNYYKTDKNKKLTINKSLELIEIMENHKSTKIDVNDINHVIMTTGLERAGSSIWSGYYYYQIDLKNVQIVFITSLLIKQKEFPFEVDIKRHLAFLFANFFDPTKDLKLRQSNKDKMLIDYFYEKYSDYSLEKLNEIVKDKNTYENSAIKAAERLINEKITVANKL